jgi:hypothetical protein
MNQIHWCCCMSLWIPPNPLYLSSQSWCFYLAPPLYTTFQILMEMKGLFWRVPVVNHDWRSLQLLLQNCEVPCSSSSSQSGRETEPTRVILSILCHRVFFNIYYYYYLSLGSVSMLRKQTIIIFQKMNSFKKKFGII